MRQASRGRALMVVTRRVGDADATSLTAALGVVPVALALAAAALALVRRTRTRAGDAVGVAGWIAHPRGPEPGDSDAV